MVLMVLLLPALALGETVKFEAGADKLLAGGFQQAVDSPMAHLTRHTIERFPILRGLRMVATSLRVHVCFIP